MGFTVRKVVMSNFFVAWIAVLIACAPIDVAWLTVSKAFYQREIGSILLGQIRMAPAVLFYLMYTAAITHFVLIPTLNETVWKTLLTGALFGFAAYATYDLTNYATLRDFTLKVALVDMIWGTVMTATVATLARLGLQWFGVVGR
jgi:uncharacterized membrane protein